MKLRNSKLTAMLVLLSFVSYMPLSTSMAMAIDANTLPSVKDIVNGSYSYENVGGANPTFNHIVGDATAAGASQNGVVSIMNLNNANLGANGTWNVVNTGINQTGIAVDQQGAPTQFFGKLNNFCVAGAGCDSYPGTNKYVMVNPAGIMFGEGSQVNLNSFTASTFNVQGLKDLKDMTPEEIAAYKTNITFVGNDNQHGIKAEGANFNIDKSLAMVSNNINLYKGSKISTNLAFNYGGNSKGEGNNQVFSNVKLVTADGVNFTYLANGAISKVKTAKDSEAGKNISRNIDIKDSTITSGSVYIQNRGSKAGNDINISNSVIKGVKLVNGNGSLAERGDIYIVGENDINVNNSEVATFNMNKQYAKKSDGTDKLDSNGNKIAITNDSFNADGATIRIKAGKNATIKNTNMSSAYSTKNYQTNDANGNKILGSGAGDIAITADKGSAKIEDTKVLSKGDLIIAAAAKVDAKNAVIQAKNNYDTASTKKAVAISAGDDITFDNSYSESSGTTTFYSPKKINSNNSLIYSGSQLELLADETNLVDSTLAYNGLSLIKDANLLNDVTIKGSTALLDTSSNDLTVKTNGNLIVDANKLQRRGFKSTIKNDYTYELTLNTAQNQKGNINLESTNGTVTVKDSDVTAAKNIAVKAVDSTKGETFITNSKLTANGTDATSGVSITQAKTHKAGVNLDKNSTITGGNINITTKNANADIIADQADFAKMNYNKMALNAGRNNTITGSKDGGMTINNVTFTANNGSNSITYNSATPSAANNLTVSNSVLNATKGTSTVASNGTTILSNVLLNSKDNNIAALYDVNLNNTEIQAATAKAEDTRTEIRAGRDLTTNNTVLKVNGTKLVADSNKKMDLVVAGANNRNAGIEINASARNNGTQGNKVNSTVDVELYGLADSDVKINAADDVLAISKIKAGSLNLDSNDSFLAALTTLTADETAGVTADTAGKGYIEVANFGQFNLDPMETFADYDKQPTDFSYTDHFVRGETTTPSGSQIEAYKKHFIEFDNNGTLEQFLLVYDKPITGCEEPPVVPSEPFNPFEEDDTISSLVEQIRLPRQIASTSNSSPIANNTTDPTSGIVSAAAKIEVASVDSATTNNTKEDEYEI